MTWLIEPGSAVIISHLPHCVNNIDNILHHHPVARNPRLVDALVKLRLVNRSNLGVQRMYRSLLEEAKEPPVIEEQGDTVKVTFLARDISPAFRAFVEEENRKNRLLSINHLLILSYLLHHQELTSSEAARLCQRKEIEARAVLGDMEKSLCYLERGGTGRGTYWTLRTPIHTRLEAPGNPHRDSRIDWEAAKTRVLSVLSRNMQGLSNTEIRQITHFDRNQVLRLMRELMDENKNITHPGHGRYARYRIAGNAASNET